MTDKQPEALRQAAWLKKEGASCQRHYDLGVLIERQYAELETLRTGYEAARLEIESLRKEHADELSVAYMCGASREKELAAQQPGAAGLIGELEDAQRAINSMKVEAETAAQGDEQMMLEACETISNEGLQAGMAIRAALASHGKAPAQAAAPAHAGEYPALVCDYCGALTPDPWHSSGMLHGKMSKHIHSCDACCRGATQPAPVRGTPADLPPLPDPDLRDVGTTPEDIKNFLTGLCDGVRKGSTRIQCPGRQRAGGCGAS
jgi:hypothetical protein